MTPVAEVDTPAPAPTGTRPIAPAVVLTAAEAGQMARRIYHGDRAYRLLADAETALSSASAGHDRSSCACEVCPVWRRVNQHLWRAAR